MKRDKTKAYIGLLVYGVAAALCVFSLFGCISQRTYDTFKSHAVETGIAAGAGALAVATGGGAAIPIIIGGMGTAAFIGEVEKPQAQTEHTTTVIDDKGKILSQKTTTSAVKAAPTAMELLTERNLIILALIVIALLFPGARALAVQALAGALRMVKAAPGWIAAHLKSVGTQKRPEKRASAQMRSAHTLQPKDPANPQ